MAGADSRDDSIRNARPQYASDRYLRQRVPTMSLHGQPADEPKCRASHSGAKRRRTVGRRCRKQRYSFLDGCFASRSRCRAACHRRGRRPRRRVSTGRTWLFSEARRAIWPRSLNWPRPDAVVAVGVAEALSSARRRPFACHRVLRTRDRDRVRTRGGSLRARRASSRSLRAGPAPV